MEITASAKSPLDEQIEVEVTLPDRFSAEVVEPLEFLIKMFCEMLEHNLRSILDVPMAASVMVEKMGEAASMIAVYGKLVSEGKITREELARYRRLQNLFASTRV